MAAGSHTRSRIVSKILDEVERRHSGHFRFSCVSKIEGNFEGEPLFERFTIRVSPGEKAPPSFTREVTVDWLLPAGENLIDLDGMEWTSPLLVVKRSGQGLFIGGSLKGKDAPDLGEMDVIPAWAAWARDRWCRFARDLARASDGFDPQTAAARLEGNLNSPWAFRRERELAGFSVSVSEKPEGNPLKRIESGRQVNIQSLSQEEGLPRLPHKSHKTLLCPFQTPESKKIGLHLFRAVNTEYRPDKLSLARTGSDENAFLFSLATGLIPYPHHTDGPRLLMGGKNLKQAEPGIHGTEVQGAEAPEVPGYLEGERSNLVNETRIREALISGSRFKPFLGTNAIVAIMPYGGFTFQDGIVISESFALKMAIDGALRTQTVFLDLDVPKDRCPDNPEAVFGREMEASLGGTLNFDDPLPLPASLEGLAIKRYRFRIPGKLAGTRLSVERQRGDGKKGKKAIRLSIRLDYDFSCDLPLGIGDKLTGRHGNKGVVTRILPDKDTPKVKLGSSEIKVDLILSPCSVIGRKNLGQIWEMMHGLALWAQKQGLILEKNSLFPNRDIDYDDLVSNILPPLSNDLGMDDRGTFPVTIPETGKTVRAFAGIQYFSRLHHHALDKLQARGPDGPVSALLGLPAAGGLKTAQCLGEMENWSVLSYPPRNPDNPQERLLLSLRGPEEKTGKVLVNILCMLGTGLAGCSPKGEKIRLSTQEALNAIRKLGRGSGRPSRTGMKDDDRFWSIGSGERKDLAQVALRARQTLAASGNTAPEGIGSRPKKYFDPAVFNLFDPETSALTVWERILAEEDRVCLALKDCLLCALSLEPLFDNPATPAGRLESDCFHFLRLLQRYRESLVSTLLGKKGLVRSHMARRRLPRSGRAVIVPAPWLRPDEILLPKEMLCEALHCDPGTLDENPWCLAVRQPSLHRHSVQAFRARCWDRPVIGLPPFVTAGFNADFDGDTMAVFFPEKPRDLSHMSILRNPGLVGTGAPALETGYDLALGWGALGREDRETLAETMGTKGFRFKGAEQEKAFVEALTLGKAMGALLEGQQENEEALGEGLRILQEKLCAASTGSCSFPPLEIDALHQALSRKRNAGPAGRRPSKPELVEMVVEELKGKFFAEGHIHRLLMLKAKGGADELNVMCGALGKQELDVTDTETGGRETRFIENNLWVGLSDDDLFASSYSARSSMASKKLAVAKAGYLSRRLAEGLYETAVWEADCGSETGIGIRYVDPGKLLLIPPGGGTPFSFPLMAEGTEKDPEALAGDLARIAWGRVPVHCKRPLGNDDLRAVLHKWLGKAEASKLRPELEKSLEENGWDLVLRSPLACRAEGANVCAVCVGADPGGRPFGTGHLLPVGSHVGLTAAQAIGERGTQLAMKRFHTGSGETIDVAKINRLLIHRPMEPGTVSRLQAVLECLSDPAQLSRANRDLPQQLVHFEIALRAAEGLEAWATDTGSRGALAVLSYGGSAARRLLASQEPLEPGESLKARIVWGEAH
jgi:hypothetical protein